ncbi:MULTISPECIES: hypothetical protein [Bacillus]|uniref:hypothetical protein n=1 Tax=Bacillus TaxID=1386 RepID=UPI000D023BD5|nr:MULTISPECIES: hypothetical protein [Bacillus]AZV51977.1 hypothetical protein DKE43_02245 [Bacillus pumilus]MBU5259605.1 hypothetical protein [Bacillus pumilus]PRS70670.1 hypothetical protein C6347_07890 [Bacillus sp. NMTD17]PSB69472.1 hypothetical protein C6Y07_12820 [Bacillus sp. LNXM12-1]PSB74533.1 hypothetical protein C6345_01935 [Bacillus sp. LNXM12-2]
MTMLKSTLFRRIFIIFFALTFMISLFNMAVFPGTPASYYVGLICKMLFIGLLNGLFFGTIIYLIVTLLFAKSSKENQ